MSNAAASEEGQWARARRTDRASRRRPAAAGAWRDRRFHRRAFARGHSGRTPCAGRAACRMRPDRPLRRQPRAGARGAAAARRRRADRTSAATAARWSGAFTEREIRELFQIRVEMEALAARLAAEAADAPDRARASPRRSGRSLQRRRAIRDLSQRKRRASTRRSWRSPAIVSCGIWRRGCTCR